MTTHRFVHLSDVHFGQEKQGSAPTHDDVRKMLVQDVEQLANDRGPATYVLVTGDSAFSGQRDQFRRAADWLEKLTRAARCKETDVRVIPGNHDCDRKANTRLAMAVHRDIRQGTPKSGHGYLEDLARGSDEANPLLPKLQEYRAFASAYASDFESVRRPVWTTTLSCEGGVGVRLIGLNSVQISDDADSPGGMILGSTQYILPPDDKHVIWVVLTHHPLEWCIDKHEAKQYFASRASVIMCGHEHLFDMQKVADLNGNEWIVLFASATNPPELESAYTFAYNWIEMSVRQVEGVWKLGLTVYPRIWSREAIQFIPDTNRLGGNPSVFWELACPKVQALPPEHLASTAPSPPPVTAGGKQEVAVSVPLSEDAVARLKYLFWRHLDWQARLKVLVAADVLPGSADRPVPQTLEHAALDNARKQGKLKRVWEAMVPFLPPEKRQPSPFPSDSKETAC